jgi:hypothetical protein
VKHQALSEPKTKAGKGTTEKRAWGSGLRGEAFFCLDVIRMLFDFFKALIISLCSVLVTFGSSQK